jgi:hypothetical protein
VVKESETETYLTLRDFLAASIIRIFDFCGDGRRLGEHGGDGTVFFF